jgi:hypothetical protein
MAYELMTFGGKSFWMSNGTTTTKGTGGPLYTYRIGTQKGLGLSLSYVIRFIDGVLGHASYGWTRNGRVRFRRTESDTPGTFILIAAPGTVDKLCYPLDTAGEVSCRNGNKVILNVDRWRTGVPHYSDIYQYRTMLVNHEMGHRIGQKHRNCPGTGKTAPVMQQQTYGMQGCKRNWWPLDSEVASLPAPTTTARASLMSVGVGEQAVEDDLELE